MFGANRRAAARNANAVAVLWAIARTRPPYADEVQRRSGLTGLEFSAAVERLTDSGAVIRCSAPKGGLLYATVRSWGAYLG